VSGAADLPLGRGREELRAAEALLEAGFPAQAVSHAYLGECPATSSGVISAFGRHVVGQDGVDHETGRVLRRLYEDRNEIDHGLVDAPLEEALGAVADAGRLVEATATWIGRREGGEQDPAEHARDVDRDIRG
jgi:uncharacterized protein (UPF0332 family)